MSTFFDVVSIFPEMFSAFKTQGIVGRAATRGICHIQCWNPREYSSDKHGRVDDYSYGGGPGMVMSLPPLHTCVESIRRQRQTTGYVITPSPQGVALNQKIIKELSLQKNLIFVCGRYEGIDERFVEEHVDLEVSVGDFVVSGGELPSMLMIDAIARLLPNVLNIHAVSNESFTHSLLDWPHYTRPETYNNRTVPSVLLSGNHHAIQKWRHQQALQRTWLKRPDLLDMYPFNEEDKQYIEQLQREKMQK